MFTLLDKPAVALEVGTNARARSITRSTKTWRSVRAVRKIVSPSGIFDCGLRIAELGVVSRDCTPHNMVSRFGNF
jgi:hypothetical protein